MSEDDDDGTERAAEQWETEFWKGVFECPYTIRLEKIGDELVKVRQYANERVINDKFSQAIINLTSSAYAAGVCPLIRVEQTLNIARELDNEYGYALAVRAYIEVGGRVHKGTRLLEVFERDTTKVEELHNGATRLLGRYTPAGEESRGIFMGKGFNVMSFVQAFRDKLPEVEEVYDDLSAYVHGDYGEQLFARKLSRLFHARGEQSPVIEKYSNYLGKVRNIIFTDFDLLLEMTRVLRERQDKTHSRE